jgi:hypothetical protein
MFLNFPNLFKKRSKENLIIFLVADTPSTPTIPIIVLGGKYVFLIHPKFYTQFTKAPRLMPFSSTPFAFANMIGTHSIQTYFLNAHNFVFSFL